MIGVAAAQLGSLVGQITFSVVLQLVGSPVAELVPLRLGPRHCGQLAPAKASAGAIARTSISRFIPIIVTSGFLALRRMPSSPRFLWCQHSQRQEPA